MAGEGYTTAGGALKLKGVVGSKVDKKKKKKRKVEGDLAAHRATSEAASAVVGSKGEEAEEHTVSGAVAEDAVSSGAALAEETASPVDDSMAGKTEAERKHEELRRQRVCPNRNSTVGVNAYLR